MVVPDALRVPGATNGIASLFFTTQTALLQTPPSSVTFVFPLGFFGSAPPTILSQMPSGAFSTVSLGSSPSSFILTTNQLLAPGGFNVTLGSLTFGASPIPAGCIGNLYAQSSTDLRSINVASAGTECPILVLNFEIFHLQQSFYALKPCCTHIYAPGSLGGQVQNVALILGIAAGLPGTNQPVTISFTTQTALTSAANGQISISWPSGYLSPVSGSTFNIQFSGSANTFVSPATGTASGVTIVVGTAGAPAGAYTITLQSALISSARPSKGCRDASQDNCIFISTTYDRRGFASYPAILPKGQVQGVSVSILESDRFMRSSSKPTLTISFTTQTDLVQSNAVSMYKFTLIFFCVMCLTPFFSTWPLSYMTSIGDVYWTGPASTFGTFSQVGSTGLTLPVGSAGAPMGTCNFITFLCAHFHVILFQMVLVCRYRFCGW